MAIFGTKQDPNDVRLAELEQIINKHIDGFIQAGTALATIRDEQLYRKHHKTFAEYVAHRWGMTARRAYQLIAAAAAAENVKHISPTPNARQAAELAAAPKELQPAIWQEVIEQAGDKQPTADQVKRLATRAKKKRPMKRKPKAIRLRVPGAIIIIERRTHESDPVSHLQDAIEQLRSRSAAA